MTDADPNAHARPVEPNPEKPTDQWVTGEEPMTGPQQSYLQTLAREAGEPVPEGLTKAEASDTIDRLQRLTGRGGPTTDRDPSGTDEDPQAENAVIVPDQATG